MSKVETFVGHLQELPDSELIGLWNTYCSKEQMEEEIFNLHPLDFNEQIGESKSFDVLKKCRQVNVDDDYFYFNGRGECVSFSKLGEEKSPISVYDLAEWCKLHEVEEWVLFWEEYEEGEL